MAAAVVTPDNH